MTPLLLWFSLRWAALSVAARRGRRRPRDRGPYCKLCWDYGCPTPHTGRQARPDNPENGHPWDCACFPCALYWDTAAGTATHAASTE
jgi:hypothetical protein